MPNGTIEVINSPTKGRIQTPGENGRAFQFHVSQIHDVDTLTKDLVGRNVSFNENRVVGPDRIACGGIDSVTAVRLLD